MPRHRSLYSMIKEALQEMLIAVEYCIKYQKKIQEWEIKKVGCLGFPAAILLFSIVDTIGSFVGGDPNFRIVKGGKQRLVKSVNDHFYILNENFYDNQNLDDNIIDQIYNCYRSLLTHHCSLPPGYHLGIGNKNDKPFILSPDRKAKKYAVIINLKPFYELSKSAVEKFNVYLQSHRTELKNNKKVIDIMCKAKDSKNVLISLPTTGYTESIVVHKDDN